MALPKLKRGLKYVITGPSDEHSKKYCNERGVKFPQTVIYDGASFLVKSNTGINIWGTSHFDYKNARPATIEIYKSRGAIRFRVKGANGKLLNHQYNDKRGCKRGIKALEAALRDYEIVDLTK